MTSTNNVLIFGPTGAVGRSAAIEAHQRGANVWLAMRDPSKSILGLDGDKPGYTRIQADLSDPSSLKAAVQKSGAKTAFVYVLHGSPDAMRASFDALKEAGITYVALLSSYSVQGAASDEENHKQFIPQVHASAEIALEASGLSFTAIRPAYFNSNVFTFYGPGISKGEVDILYPDIRFDFIAPSDIGKVCGALLTSPPTSSSSNIIYLTGPDFLTQREGMEIIGNALGKEIKINAVDEQDWFEKLSHIPRPILETLAEGHRKSNDGHETYPKDTYEEGRKGIERVTGKKATSLGEWANENKGSYT